MKALPILLCAVLFFGVGCQSQQLASATPEALAAESDFAVAEAFYHTRAPSLAQELERRKLIQREEWKAVYSNEVVRGMTEPAVRASWGPPRRVNVTVTAGGESRQLCYSPDEYGIHRAFVYIDNGRASAWQASTR